MENDEQRDDARRIMEYSTHFSFCNINPDDQEVWINDDEIAMIVNVNADGSLSSTPFLWRPLNNGRSRYELGSFQSVSGLRVYKKPDEAFSTSATETRPFIEPQPSTSGLSERKRAATFDVDKNNPKRMKFSSSDIAAATAEALIATAIVPIYGFLAMLRHLLSRLSADARLALQIKILTMVKAKLNN